MDHPYIRARREVRRPPTWAYALVAVLLSVTIVLAGHVAITLTLRVIHPECAFDVLGRPTADVHCVRL